jgi:hypothetical protein
MTGPSDDTDRKQCIGFVNQILTDAVECRATEILFRAEPARIQSFYLVDGKYEKNLTIPKTYWDLARHILRSDYFDSGQYQIQYQGELCIFEWSEDENGVIRLKISRKPIPGQRIDRIEDIFRQFEDPSWDAVKSIFLSVLNLALEQGYDEIILELDGATVEIQYFLNGTQKTGMTISSDSYHALTRLIGENYFAFGFMTRDFREKEYLVRLKELNEEKVAPRIRLEIEELA